MIEVEKLTKRYGSVVAVDEVSFSVEEGSLMVLLGGSGSGKTTTLKMINRLIEPTSGTIRIDGEDIRGMAPHALRRKIGYAFQKIGLFPHMSVAENIGVTPSLLRWPRAKIDKRVDELLDMVELEPKEVRDRMPRELSGGQQQRIGVARALAARPKVMLLDEPFGALDPVTRERVQNLFLKLRKDVGLTAIFVTHDMVEALLLADVIGVMDQGKMVQVGSPRELLNNPATEFVEHLMSTPRNQAEFVESLVASGES